MVTKGKSSSRNILWSSQFISDVQSYFGVEKLQLTKNSRNDDVWVSVNVSKRDQGCVEIDKHHTFTPRYILSASKDKIANGHSSGEKNIVYYRVRSKLWYYLFLFGTQLGEEPFCALFFSFWFWNLDSSIGRKLVLVWNMVMYVGQYLKDLIQWERPQVPIAVQLQTKWSEEYGMPSTHAMLGLAVPTSAFIFTLAKYELSTNIAIGTIG